MQFHIALGGTLKIDGPAFGTVEFGDRRIATGPRRKRYGSHTTPRGQKLRRFTYTGWGRRVTDTAENCRERRIATSYNRFRRSTDKDRRTKFEKPYRTSPDFRIRDLERRKA